MPRLIDVIDAAAFKQLAKRYFRATQKLDPGNTTSLMQVQETLARALGHKDLHAAQACWTASALLNESPQRAALAHEPVDEATREKLDQAAVEAGKAPILDRAAIEQDLREMVRDAYGDSVGFDEDHALGDIDAAVNQEIRHRRDAYLNLPSNDQPENPIVGEEGRYAGLMSPQSAERSRQRVERKAALQPEMLEFGWLMVERDLTFFYEDMHSTEARVKDMCHVWDNVARYWECAGSSKLTPLVEVAREGQPTQVTAAVSWLQAEYSPEDVQYHVNLALMAAAAHGRHDMVDILLRHADPATAWEQFLFARHPAPNDDLTMKAINALADIWTPEQCRLFLENFDTTRLTAVAARQASTLPADQAHPRRFR